MRCVPPLRSRPRWMWSVRAASNAPPETPFGIPKIPKRKKNSVATINTIFQRRFLVINAVSNFQFEFRESSWRGARDTKLGTLFGLYFVIGRGHLRHRGLGYFHQQVVRRHAQMDAVILQSHDGAPQAATGGDFVAGLELIEHAL